MSDAIIGFLEAMRSTGIHPVEPIEQKLISGNAFRFRAEGDRPGRRNGWAVLHLDGFPAGVFRHYRLGIRQVWRAGVDPRALNPAERRQIIAKAREAEAKRKAETRREQEAAAANAQTLWAQAKAPDPAHAYLVRKSLHPFGIRQRGADLLVPMFDPAFKLWNVQSIAPDGSKRFLKGGRTSGLFWPHAMHLANGKPSNGPLVIGEGYSTLAAIHDATGYSVCAAMSARNLGVAAKAIRKLFPGRQIIVAADDDRHLTENIGLEAARKAAESIGVLLALPLPETLRTPSGADFADIGRHLVADRLANAQLVEA